MIRNYFFLLCCTISISVCAQTIDTAKLNAYFDTLEGHDKFMGSVAVSHKGQLVYTKTIGYSDAASLTRATEQSKYRIGSISKTFTAVLVLKAVEENRLELNQSVGSFFPGINGYKNITIRDLLNHRSGIHNFTDNKKYLNWNTEPKTKSELVKIIAKGGSDFKPGTKAAYSNSNYVLLTYILEDVFQQSYAELIRTYIAQPLQLHNTYMGKEITTQANECHSYSYADGWKKASETAISIPLGSGGIVSTPSDLVTFSDGLFTGKLLTKESMRSMQTIQDGFGLGLFQIPFYEKIGYGHRGGIDKFTAVFSYFPEDSVSFALISNGTNYSNNEIPLAVLNAVFGKLVEIPDFSEYAVDPATLDKYTGNYSSEQIPLQITLSKEGDHLIAQATGQLPKPLKASAAHTFRFDETGIVLRFEPTNNTMYLQQGGSTFVFMRK